jgi:DNA-binding NtrC family response regulator
VSIVGNRILLFHNDLKFLASTKAALGAEGFDVVAVNNSLAAWETLSDVHRRFDVLITRVAGPEGSPPGLALVRHFRMNRLRSPVVIVDTPDNAHFADGESHVLVTPVSAQGVLNAVRAALASPTLDGAEGA